MVGVYMISLTFSFPPPSYSFLQGIGPDRLNWFMRVLMNFGLKPYLDRPNRDRGFESPSCSYLGFQSLEHVQLAEFADNLVMFIKNKNGTVAVSCLVKLLLSPFQCHDSLSKCVLLQRPWHTQKAGPSNLLLFLNPILFSSLSSFYYFFSILRIVNVLNFRIAGTGAFNMNNQFIQNNGFFAYT